MTSPVVFFDIAGPDDDVLKKFYSKVFDWNIDSENQFSMKVNNPLEAAIRKDPAEKRIYLGVDDIHQSMKLIEEFGGSVDVPRFEVKGVVVLGLFKDPAGNEMGLVEMDGDNPKVPK